MRTEGSALLVALAMSQGCATTDVESLVNPMIVPGVYSRIMIAFPAPDAGLRRVVEDEFVLQDAEGGTFVQSYEVLPPERSHGSEVFFQLLDRNRIDAVLMIGLTEEGVERGHAGQTSSLDCPPTDPSPGCLPTLILDAYSGAERPWATFVSSLYDVEQGIVVWRASAKTEGQPWSGSEHLLRSLSRRTVARLTEDGIFRVHRDDGRR